VEEMSPEHPADESDGDSRPDDPHGAPPSEPEVEATVEADSTSPDADAEVSETEVDASHADEGAMDATAPSAR
jgi:hypothetical protein